MGFFDKMKAMVGVGSPKLVLDLEPPVFAAGTLSVTISLVREHAAKMSDDTAFGRVFDEAAFEQQIAALPAV